MRIWSQIIVISCFTLSLLQGVHAAAQLVQTEHNISEYKLDNGFRVILAPNPQENKIYMNTIYLTGALNDPKGKGGLAHLLEHLAFKGTQNIPATEFQRRLDQNTLFNNASTSYYATQYSNVLRPEPKAIQTMLELEAERMDKLVLKAEFVPSEIEIVKREREMRQDQPFAVLMDQVWKGLYGDAFLGRPPIGDLSELKSIQMPELQQFYRTWYAPNNAVMVIAGQFDATQVLKDVEHQFGAIAARDIPAQPKVPALNLNQLKNRSFTIQKGSNHAKFLIYVQPNQAAQNTAQNAAQNAALDVLPELMSLQPSGRLYRNVVETGKATSVQVSTWLEPDFQVIFAGAVYAPNMNEKAIDSALKQTLEQPQTFNATELKRVQQLLQNGQDSFWSNSGAVSAMLSDYVVSEQGNWRKYFQDHAALMALTPEQVNQVYGQVLQPQQRLEATLKPTAASGKTQTSNSQTSNAQTTNLAASNRNVKAASASQASVAAEPLLDAKTYQQQVQNYLPQSAQRLSATEAKIQRGQLAVTAKDQQPVQYAIFNTPTRDGKSYATISLQFADATRLKGQSEALDILTYLLLRGTDQYDLQAIADKSIALGGSAAASLEGNTLNIGISAKHENFQEYLTFILDLVQHANFSQTQFDLIRSQQLASLNRPYTEPQTVAGMTLARLTERYAPDDLRYHFEPERAKLALQKLRREDVVALYNRVIGAQHAQVAVTGLVDAAAIKGILQQRLQPWQKNAPYAYIGDDYTPFAAQQLHVQAEPREFGFYLSLLTLPVGVDHPDAPALIVMNHILGGSQLTSRLAKTLREAEGLVYGFGSNLSFDSVNNVGNLSVSANYSAAKAEQVQRAVLQVIQDLRQNGVTEQELAAAQADILKQRVTTLEDERNIHAMLNSQMQRGKTLLQREQRDQAFAQLKKADIDRVIRQYLQPEQWLAVMADQYGQPLDAAALTAKTTALTPSVPVMVPQVEVVR